MALGEAVRSNEEWLADLRGETERADEAQKDLRARIAAAIRKVTAGRGLDDALLDDLTQVALLRVLEVLDRFEGRSRFTTWAYSVAVRAALSELRKPAYRQEAESDEALGDVEEEGSAEADAVRQEIVEIMHRVIESELTERQRTAVLGELRGRPQEELLEELGIQRNALYKLQHDARNKLRAGLAAAGICDHAVREAFDL